MSATVRCALQELSAAALWCAQQPDPRKAMTGYSWFNVALEELDNLVPDRLSVEGQVADAIRAAYPREQETQ